MTARSNWRDPGDPLDNELSDVREALVGLRNAAHGKVADSLIARADELLEGTPFADDIDDSPPEPECHCTEYAGPCYLCVDQVAELVGKTVRDCYGREGVVTDHGENDSRATVSFGEHHWGYLDDVEVIA